MLKIWIAGSAGQIGTAINEVLDPLEMEVFNTDKDELDITPSGCDHQLCRNHRYGTL